MKNKDLYSFFLELQNSSNSIFVHLLRAKVAEFKKQNKMRFNILLEKLETLQREFFEFEDEKNVKYEVSETGEKKPVMLEGKLWDDYMALYGDLMDKDVPIIF